MIAVFPDRVHVLVRVPARGDPRAMSRELQRAVAHLLNDAQVIPRLNDPLWAADAWCAVLPSETSVRAVREMLRRRLAISTPAAGVPR